MAEEKSNNVKKDIIENVKEKASEFIEDTKDALGIAKEKLDETLSEKQIKKIKQKSDEYADIAEAKAVEFASEAKKAFEDRKENTSELIGAAAEHIADFAEDAKKDLKEITEKSKSFLQKLFKK